ncbi:alpha/beta hydrolase [Maribacter halichondriae]|uniref:alpha/beta hydrolase n=1 Tax=Maribacter halichondriae TaxID=2980554 RepID=UPI0023596B45|nr:alpha/beta hydrolase [Maribacter sp. Hal144]
MRIIWKVVKWIGISIGSLLLLIILAGLCLRLFSSKPQPPGELVDVGGFKLHINSMGEKNNKPTLVIESGAGAPSEYYYWLGEGLKDSIRVVRYDRAGIGYSELSNTLQDPETVARELHTLLQEAGESPPYIMAGHSYGGHYIRVFKQLYPNEVTALVFLDSGHPDEHERLNMPPSPSWLNLMYKAGAVLGDLGVLDLYTRIVKRSILWAPGLPEEVTDRYQDYTLNGKYLWGYLEEEKWHEDLVEMSRKAMEFDSLPIRVFSGTHLNNKALLKMGLDPERLRTERVKMQKEMASLSTNGKVFFLDGGHITIFSLKENADIICKEIIQLSRELEY